MPASHIDPTYRVGSVIEYIAFGGETRRVRISERFDDIKNGRPGFDGELVGIATETDDPDELLVWGYDNQILRVVKL
jgi:hypothetical protein